MTHNGRFLLALRILLTLAAEPKRRQTSTELAERLGTSPVMVRRLFGLLHASRLISKRKGPTGGAKLRRAPKSIRLGDLYTTMEPNWLAADDQPLDFVIHRARKDAIAGLNKTTLAEVLERQTLAQPAKARA